MSLHPDNLLRRQLGALFGLLLIAVGARAAELPDFTVLAKSYGPAVVNISSQKVVNLDRSLRQFQLPDLPEDSPFNDLFRHFFQMPEGGKPGAKSERRSLGSGFMISEDGYIVTNHHVIDGAEEITVKLSDRREFAAKVIGSDKRTDVALLKIDGKDLPVVKVSRSDDVQVGEWVLAIGSPFGLDHTVTAGIVSAKGRSLPDENYVPFIQTDVAINPGNSGGPLFNLRGEVIGVNSQIFSRTGGFMGLSFAIPMDVAMNVVDQLRNNGHVTRGWIGVYIQDVTRDLAESFGLDAPKGALVAKVMPGGPAEKAGLQVGDVILSYNGKAVIASAELPHLVGQTAVGQKAEIRLLRRGDELVKSLEIGQMPDEEKLADVGSQGGAGEQRLGLAARDLTVKEREKLGIRGDVGVLVSNVTSGAAAQAGVQPDDVIMMIDNKPVKNMEQFQQLVNKLPSGRSVALLVQRQSGSLFLALRLANER